LFRSDGSRHLGEDVDAVGLLIDHPPDSTHLALDAVHARQESVLVGQIAGIAHRSNIPPGGILCQAPKSKVAKTVLATELRAIARNSVAKTVGGGRGESRLAARGRATGTKMETMAEYEEKRRFDETPEPEGAGAEADVDPLTAPTGDSFVIQQHYATRLHHDVRLEMLNGDTPVLVSWAVPKGLPRQRGERHLAIRTEDHPFEYGT